VHSTTYLSPSAITWQRAPIRDIIAKWYTCISYTSTMKGQNVCSWLPLGFYKVCGRSCIGKYCGDHLICMQKGSRGPKACVKCGIGVKVRLVYVWTVVTTDGLITLPIGKAEQVGCNTARVFSSGSYWNVMCPLSDQPLHSRNSV